VDELKFYQRDHGYSGFLMKILLDS